MTVAFIIVRCLFVAAFCLSSVISLGWKDGQCPCTNQSLCQPIQLEPRREKFAFIVNTNNWRSYDYSQLTTIGMFIGDLPGEFLCFAHSQQVRLVWATGYDSHQLGNVTAREEWKQMQLEKVKSTFTDGINIDFEHSIKNGSEAAQQYTSLVREMTDLFHAEVPGSQVSVDVAWSAPCKDKRCYDYTGLANASDFLFIMGYDVRSEIFDINDCIASANAPIASLQAGLVNYTQLFQISPWKLVLGVPWYCYDYRCISIDANMTCKIHQKTGRKLPCSGMTGEQHHYSICRELLRVNATTGPIFDNRTGAIYFNYNKDGHGPVHQVWMDDPQSLLIKYDLANNFHLRGVGMWNADCLDYSANASSQVQQDARDMWNALRRFQTKTNEDDEWFHYPQNSVLTFQLNKTF